MIDRLLAELARHKFLHELVLSTLVGLSVYVVCALFIVGAELFNRRGLAVYRTSNALNDLAYAVFYQCSIYNLIVAPFYAFIAPHVQFLRIGVLSNLPMLVAVPLCWLIFDFLNYWTHRLQHAVEPLWALHSVHHSQTVLTFFTGSRIHFLEQLYVGLLLLAPAFILGLPQPRWLPLLFVQLFTETVSHARLNWTYGPLHGVIVSPAFHHKHHSIDERDYNRNFARVLSIWDRLFGTMADRSEEPTRFGIAGVEVPNRLGAQFVYPLRWLITR